MLVADILYDRKTNAATVVLSVLLLPLSLVFLWIVKFRRFLYKKHVFLSHELGCPVIAVGNITLGGTGKTPIVGKLADELRSVGRNVAVLSRGYKSKGEPICRSFWRVLTNGKEPPPKVVSDGKSVLLSPDVAGDEPYMLAQNLPGVAVVVDKDRVKAGRYAIKNFGADILILDDGYQYFRLHGHTNLLLIDSTNPFGNNRLLPRGILREPLSAINRASHVFITKADGKSDVELQETVRCFNPSAKIIKCEHFPKNLVSLDRKNVTNVGYLAGKKIMAFSGIASPDGFENFLTKNRAEIVYKKRFADHHMFSHAELENIFIAGIAKGAEFAVTTEKDAVRIPREFGAGLPIFFIKIEIKITAGEDIFQEIIKGLK